MTSTATKNLAALAATDPSTALLIREAPESPPLAVVRSRTGQPVPIVQKQEKTVALHSRFDPSKEAERLLGALRQQKGGLPRAFSHERAGYLVFQGLGAGYQIRSLLRREDPAYCLVLDTEPVFLRQLLSAIDLSDLLADSRVHLLVDAGPAEISAHLRETYLPAVMGGFLSIPLRSRTDLAPHYFETARTGIRNALEEIADDYTVQSSFGRMWTRNILTNLALAVPSNLELPQVHEAIVVAAGPSLEDQMPQLERLRPGRFLVATDTALPLLRAAGQTPDAVLTIDCQNLGYHHFLSGLSTATTLIFELASPPAITRLSADSVMVSGGHPLSRLAAAYLGGVPAIDTSGGNVGHAGVSLALRLGAQAVHLFGADFSYPYGRAYARGTYLYPYFEERQSRISTAEGGHTELMYRNTTLERESFRGGFRYTTQTLRSYRDRFLSAFAGNRESIRVQQGAGLELEFPTVASAATTPVVPPARMRRDEVKAGAVPPPPEKVRRFLAEYREAVAQLSDNIPSAKMGTHDRESGVLDDGWRVFASFYPLIAHIRREGGGDPAPEYLISRAKEAVVALIDRIGTATGRGE